MLQRKSAPHGDKTKQYIMTIHFNMYNIKNTYSSCNYNNTKVMATIMLTYSWLQLIDMQLFTMYCLYVHKHLISMFVSQKDQVPVKSFDSHCVGVCFVHQNGRNEK
jgi:hypothetical protein